MAKVRVAIVGASGYAGEELIRLLTGHPNVELRIITSRQDGTEIYRTGRQTDRRRM